MIKDFLYIGFGSALGGILRYAVGLLLSNYVSSFPWATYLVNILGCFLIGVLARHLSDHSYTLFAVVGFCGGFTTFSSFSRETLSLIHTGQYLHAGIYTISSLILGILAVFLGSKC